MKNNPASKSFNDLIIQDLRNDPELAEELLQIAISEANTQDGDFILQKTLKIIAESRGIAEVAKSAGIPRESLYRALSKKGNPKLSTLQAISGAMGLRLTLSHMNAV